MNSRREFPLASSSVKEARTFAAGALGDVPDPPRGEIVLLISELASNSIRHAESGFTVHIDRGDDEIRVAVTDGGGGSPEVQPHNPTRASGRGLQLVEQLSDRWGIDNDSLSKTVWFSICLPYLQHSA